MTNLRNVFDWSVLLFVTIGTLFYVPFSGGGLQVALEWGYVTQELFFRYGVLFLLLFSSLLIPLRKAEIRWLVYLWVFMLIVALLMGFDVQMRRSLLNMACGVLFIKLVAEYCRESIVRKASIAFLVLLLLNLIMGVFQYFGNDPLLTPNPNLGPLDKIVGFMRMKVHLGVMTAILAPFLVLISPLLLVVSLPLLFFAKSSAAVASFTVALLFLAFKRLKKWQFGLILGVLTALCAAFVVFVDMPGGQFGERFQVWFSSLSFALKTNPILGCGIGSFAKWQPLTVQETSTELLAWRWAHNEYLQLFFEAGIVGISLVFKQIYDWIKDFLSKSFDYEYQVIFTAFLVVLGVSFLHFPFHLARLSCVCLFVFGLLELKRGELA